MKRGHGTGALLAAALCAGALAPAVAAGFGLGTSGLAGAALQPKVTLPQSPPSIPAGTANLGAPPSDQQLNLDVVLAGQNPAGLTQAVAAVSTPGSPDYHHYLTAAQFAADYGPTSAEVAQVSSALRNEGLTVGTPESGSVLLPVSGTVSAVSNAFGTSLESVRSPGHANAVVNTAAPSVSSSLSSAVTGVVGLDGLFQERSMLQEHPHAIGAPASGTQEASPHVATAHTPQACGTAIAKAAAQGGYTSTQLASVYGLDQLMGQGRTGIGQTIGVVEFDQFSLSDIQTYFSCFGLSNPVNTVLVDGGAPPPVSPDPEPAIDIELAAVNAPSAAITVYEAPNSESDVSSLDLFGRIASDDTARVVTTSWGNCEALVLSDLSAENVIFQRMAMQGQTMIAASGDAGSEDCYNPTGSPPNFDESLAVDDPGSQPDVISAGGTTLSTAAAASQTVWNSPHVGAGGGGYSGSWPLNPGQTAPTLVSNSDPCGFAQGCRAVPDFSSSADPNHGVAVYYAGQGGWNTYGGTSIVSPMTAGLFTDTNQGCFSTLGGVGPALYAAKGSSNFTDIVTGNNDYTGTHLGQFAATVGYDAASGLGTPIDQHLAIALQGGADGCPSLSYLSANTGPVSGGGAITIVGGGFANASSVNFGPVGSGQIVSQSVNSITVIPPNASAPICVDITVTNPQGVSATSPADHYGFGGDLNCGQGYRFVASDGGVFDFGDASFWGSTGGITLNKPIVGMASTPSTNGYWLVASDGGLFSFGDAGYFGSMGGQPLNKPIVGMASTPDGGGYWEVASDGGLFTFGDARFFGSAGAIHLNRPIVGMAATPDGGGYWEVASDGGIFAYGDAQYWGSTGALTLNSPIVGMASGPNGAGYWLVAADGGIFAFGSAQFYGSAGAIHLNRPIVGMAATPDDRGYWLVASDGGIFTYGDASFFGSTGAIALNKPIVGMSSS